MKAQLSASLVLLIPALLAAALYYPALALTPVSDDFNWLQQARAAASHPQVLFADLDTFYRPASTWTLVLDRSLSSRGASLHATNLAFHAIAASLLAAAACRLGASRVTATSIAVLWVTSPLTSEPALAIAIRFQGLLLCAWLGLVCCWPRARESWTAGRAGAVTAALLLALLSKETAVVTPALVLALELGRGSRWRRVAIATAPFAVASAAYLAGYFWMFPTTKGYFGAAQASAKLPHMLGSFLYLHGPNPRPVSASLADWMVLGSTIALGGLALKRRSPAILAGLALLFAAYAPTALVPYLPSRYMTIPFAGFLLALAGLWTTVAAALGPAARRLTATSLVLVAAVIATTGGRSLGGELSDMRRLSQAHRVLVEEAAEIASELPLNRPIPFLRIERTEALHELAASPLGIPKVYYVRAADPYGLVDVAALFDWVLSDHGRTVTRLSEDRVLDPNLAPLLLHTDGGFVWDPSPLVETRADLRRWRAQGVRVRFLWVTE